MEELKDISSIIANISIVIGVIIGVLQLIKFVKFTKADHERRQKQSTLEFFCDIDSETHELEKKMKVGGILHGKRSIEDIQNDQNLKELIRRYLNLMNRFSVGVNTGVYDIAIFNQTAGRRITRIYDQLYPYILHRREELHRNTIYSDFENMIENIKRMNGNSYSNSGKLKHSPL